MGYNSFNSLLIHFTSIHPKAPQHIHLLIMALLELILEAHDDRGFRLWRRMGLRLSFAAGVEGVEGWGASQLKT